MGHSAPLIIGCQGVDTNTGLDSVTSNLYRCEMRYETIQKMWAKRRKRILAMLQSGISQAEIARRLDVTRQRIYQIIKGKQ